MLEILNLEERMKYMMKKGVRTITMKSMEYIAKYQ